MFTTLSLVGLFLGNLAFAQSYLSDVPCGKTLGVPSQQSIPNCFDSYCVTASGGLQVCRCAKAPVQEDQQATAVVVLRIRDHELQRWDDSLIWPANMSYLRVSIANLDSDSTEDIVIATLQAFGNGGKPVISWVVCAVSGANLQGSPACVDVEDYGAGSYLTNGESDNACFLLQGRWRSGSEPARGQGEYLVGRWLRYEPNGFTPVASRPIVARRLLSGFASVYDPMASKPLLWFKDRRTRVISCPDPLCE